MVTTQILKLKNSRYLQTSNLLFTFCYTAQTESEVAEKSRREKLGLIWRNRKKISQITNDYLLHTVLPLNYFMLSIYPFHAVGTPGVQKWPCWCPRGSPAIRIPGTASRCVFLGLDSKWRFTTTACRSGYCKLRRWEGLVCRLGARYTFF